MTHDELKRLDEIEAWVNEHEYLTDPALRNLLWIISKLREAHQRDEKTLSAICKWRNQSSAIL